MRLPDDPNKYTSRFKYIEVGRIIENFNNTGKDKFIREGSGPKENRKPLLIHIDSLPDYANKYNNLSIYHSVYQYDSKDLSAAVPLGPLYFDLDHQDINISFSDTIGIVEYLLKQGIPNDAIDIYFSGRKGFHIEVEPIVLGISASDNLPKISSFIAHTLNDDLNMPSIDYQVYDIRRMWRAVNTQHKESKLYKIPCKELLMQGELEKIFDKAKKPVELVEKEEQKFNPKANQWYREFTYQYEQSLLPQSNMDDLFMRFLEQGSGYVKHFEENTKKFDKYRLHKGCPTVLELEQKAKTHNHLEHYERLFLCSLLTYTDEAVRYLHEILENCSDYNFEISNSHIEDWIKRREYGIGGRPFTCQKAREVGIMCGGCSKMEPKHKIINTGEGKYIESEELASPSPIRHTYTMLKGGELNG